MIDYFNSCARAHSFGIAVQIKIMGEPSLVFSISGSVLFGRLLKNIKI
jgi:hypothetical protein